MGQEKAAAQLIKFLAEKENPYKIYEIDGTVLDEDALHPVGMMAATTQGALAVIGHSDDQKAVSYAWEWVEKLWNEPLRKGNRRYYDNCLYFFAFLALSGNYRIW